MKKYQQRFAIIFSILLILSNISFLQPLVSHAAALENAVTIMAIDENGDEVLPLTAINIEDGDTAFDVLEKAGEEKDVEIDSEEHPDFGKLINAIGNKAGSDPYYWSFNVYGEGASVGASSYDVSNAEHILFSLTDDFNPTIEAKVSAIDGKGNDVIPETTVNLMAGSTAYDALYQAAKANDVELEAIVDDQYFTFINNIGEAELGDNDWWNIAVDDEVLEVGILSYRILSEEYLQLTVETFEELEDESENDEDADNTTSLPEITPEYIEQNIQELATYTIDGNYIKSFGDEWWVFGLANTDRNIPTSYSDDIKNTIKEKNGEFDKVYDLERIIISLSAMGIDATSIAEHNLIDKLLEHTDMKDPLINAEIYGLLALDSGQYDASESVRDELIASILEGEVQGGGWALTGDLANADITGMTLTALAPYQNQEEVGKAIERAVDYLSQAQDETGGYDHEESGGDSSESISQVITGLASVGIDPTSEQFTKSGGNLVQHLMKFKNGDGGFGHVLADNQSDKMATSQALLALTAYQSFTNKDGLVYQFSVEPSESEIDKPNSKTTVIILGVVGLVLVGGLLIIGYRIKKRKA